MFFDSFFQMGLTVPFVCVFQWVHFRHMCSWACSDQQLIKGVFLNHSPPYLGGQDLSLSLELTGLTSLVSQRVPGIFLIYILALLSLNHRHTLPHLALTWVLGV